MKRFFCAFVFIGWSLISLAWGQDNQVVKSTAKITDLRSSPTGSFIAISIYDEGQKLLPARVSFKKKQAGKSSGLDPVGRGLDNEGCFYSDGRFQLKVEPGTYELWARSGFSQVPYIGEMVVGENKSFETTVTLKTWFNPEDSGWYAADFHLHSFHPPVAPTDIKTKNAEGKIDYEFLALACRATGLNYVVDNLHHLDSISADEVRAIEGGVKTRDFLLELSSEIRMDPHGHVNVPGVRPGVYLRTKVDHPLPLLQILNEVHKEGGVLVYTHPLLVPFFYWMTATEMPVHMVFEEHGEFFDIGRPSNNPSIVELFGLWNLGIRVAAASTSDFPFNRGVSGKERTFLKPVKFDLTSLMQAGRDRASIASNGGTFANIQVGEHGPGSVLATGNYVLAVEAHSLEGISKIDVVADGKILETIQGDGAIHVKKELAVSLAGGGYVSVIARDRKGGYSVPTAIFGGEATKDDKFYTALYANEANREKETTNKYFLHLLCAVNSQERIKTVLIKKDGVIVEEIKNDLLGKRHINLWSHHPALGIDPDKENEKSWQFWPSAQSAQYFSLSFPMESDGEYQAIIETSSGKILDAGKIRYKKQELCWQGVIAHLWGKQGDFYLEMSGQRPQAEAGSEAIRGDWISLVKIRTKGLRGDDLQFNASPKDYHSPSALVAP